MDSLHQPSVFIATIAVSVERLDVIVDIPSRDVCDSDHHRWCYDWPQFAARGIDTWKS